MVVAKIVLSNIGNSIRYSIVATDTFGHTVTNINFEVIQLVLQVRYICLKIRDVGQHICDQCTVARQEVVIAQELVQSVLQVAAGVQAGGHAVAYMQVELINSVRQVVDSFHNIVVFLTEHFQRIMDSIAYPHADSAGGVSQSLCRNIVFQSVAQFLTERIHIRVGDVNALVDVGDGLVGNLANLLVQYLTVNGSCRVSVQGIGNCCHQRCVLNLRASHVDGSLNGSIPPDYVTHLAANGCSFTNH